MAEREGLARADKRARDSLRESSMPIGIAPSARLTARCANPKGSNPSLC